MEEHQAIAEVEVTSAQPLNATQIEKLQLQWKRLARKVKLNCNVDSSLIAGVVIRTEDFVIDGSSRGQLLVSQTSCNYKRIQDATKFN